MKYLILVDSMASVPEHVLKNREHIKVIPLNICIGSNQFLDPVDNKSLIKFYKNNPLDGESKIEAYSPTKDQFLVYMLNEVIPHYDFAICQTTTAALSIVHRSLLECARLIGAEAKILRDIANIKEPFKMSCFNSSTSSSGQTLLALYTDALLSDKPDIKLFMKKANQFKTKIRAYAVIKDIHYARNRMNHLGFKTVSLATAVSGKMRGYSPIIKIANDRLKPTSLKTRYKKAISKVFSYAEECIKSGLYLPIIHVSYAGFIKELHAMESFQNLQSTAKLNGATVISGMMSMAECINYSPGSVSLGIAPRDETAEPR